MDSPILVAELGSGGMAEVFLAMRRGMGGFVKLVVVKRLRTSAMEGDAVAMFHDEARISARLNHPNVVQTHEVGFDGEHYRLEMEYLDGQPLHRITHRAKQRGRSISAGVAVAVVQDVLAGLRYAHELRDYDGTTLGIVHRDVSPQNIFVTYDGRVKLVDFGIAKAAGQMAVTQLGMVKGKARYMAPEQATGQPVDVRADVFATGIVLWQLLVGRGYWGDADDLAVFHRVTTGKLPPRPRAVNPEVPEALDAVCARALAYRPEDRYASADEFYQALDACGITERSAQLALGTLAAELFAEARTTLRAEIEKAAARPLLEPDEQPTKTVVLSPSAASESRLAASDRPVSGAVHIPERRRSWPFVALVVAAMLGATAATAAVMRVSRSDLEASSRPSTGAGAISSALAPAHVDPEAAAVVNVPMLTSPLTAPDDRPATGMPPTSSGAAPGRGTPIGARAGSVAVTAKAPADAGATVSSVDAGGSGSPRRPLPLFTGNPWNGGPGD